MESTGAYGIHEKRGGGRDMGSVVARGLGASGRVCGLRKGKRVDDKHVFQPILELYFFNLFSSTVLVFKNLKL
jgi:hypothetical protein